MPEEHKHPDYEQTFARVATILDVIAQEQEEQARRGAETDARLDKLARDADARLDKLARDADARAREADARHREADARARDTDVRIDKLARSLQEFIDEAKIRDAETTDKLNGLINLMDRHLREHGHQ